MLFRSLGFVALIIVFAVGVPLGLLAARLAGTWLDPMIIGTLLFLQAIPVLVVIPPLTWLFAVKLQWLPVGGWDGIFALYWIAGVIAIPIPNPHLYIPLVAFTLPGFVGVARLVRVTAAENDEVVRVVDDVRVPGLVPARPTPVFQEAVHVEVGDQRTDDAALRYAQFVGPSSLHPLLTILPGRFDRCAEPLLEQPQHVGIDNAARHRLQIGRAHV